MWFQGDGGGFKGTVVLKRNTLVVITPQPTGSFVFGFILSGGGGVSGFFTDLARTNAGTPQDFAAIDLDAGETFTTFSIKQSVLFGTINEPAL